MSQDALGGLWGVLAEELAGVLAERPEDSVTPMEFSRASGLSLPYAYRVLERKVAQGKLRSVMFKPASGRRQRCYVVAEQGGPIDDSASRRARPKHPRR